MRILIYNQSRGYIKEKNIISFLDYSSRNTIIGRWKVGLSSLTLLIGNCEETEDNLVADDIFPNFTALMEHFYKLYFINI